jgi:CBS domain-containing protein
MTATSAMKEKLSQDGTTDIPPALPNRHVPSIAGTGISGMPRSLHDSDNEARFHRNKIDLKSSRREIKGGEMSLKGFFKKDVVTVSSDCRVIEAAALMRDHRIGDVVIVKTEDGVRRPIGLLTDRDIVIGSVASGAERITELTVNDIMTHHPVCALEEDGLYEVAQAMRKEGVARMPVVSESGELIGIINAHNILALLSDELSEIVEIADTHREAGQQARHRANADLDDLSLQHMQ